MLVFIAIVVVVVLTLIELTVALPAETSNRITQIDTSICFLLLSDFFLRLAMADSRRWYFRNEKR